MGTMMGRPDERHKTMRPPNCAPAPCNPLLPGCAICKLGLSKAQLQKISWAGGKNIWCQSYPIPIKDTSSYCPLVVEGGLLWDCPPGFNAILKSYNIFLSKATCHAIDNILQRDLGFFSHLCLCLCLPVGSVGGGRVCDEPASTLPSLCSSLNKGIPAFQKIVGCFRFYTAR